MEAPYSRFTAAEGGARLATAANAKNILAVEHAAFIATRLIHEQAFNIRGSLSEGRQRSVYVTRASRVACVAYDLHIMTDLAVTSAETHDAVYDWCAELDQKEVLVCTSSVLRQILKNGTLKMKNINVLIIDSAHLVWRDEHLQFIMKLYKECDAESQPRILALTYPLFNTNKQAVDNTDTLPNQTVDETEQPKDKETETETELSKHDVTETEGIEKEVDIVKENELSPNENKVANSDYVIGGYENIDDYDMYEKLEWKIEELEKGLCCEMDLAEDIDGGKRLASNQAKPKELIIEYSGAPPDESMPTDYRELSQFMRKTVNDALEFINEHRYDPTEIYGEDLYEEFKNIPDPTVEPKYIFKQFLYVLDQLGPYAADKAAFSLLAKLEKLKIKVPYERHFILLCLCTTVFVKIRCHADEVFAKIDSDWERIKSFSTPKVLRFAEVLFKFQPPELQKTVEETTAQMLSDLEKCDFKTLGDKIEDAVNTIEGNLKDLNESTVDNNIVNNTLTDTLSVDSNICSIQSVSNIKSDVCSEISVDTDSAKEDSVISKSASSEDNFETDDNQTNFKQNKSVINNIKTKNDCVISTSVHTDDNTETANQTDKIIVNDNQILSEKNQNVTTETKADLFTNKLDGMPKEGKLGFSRRSGGRVRGRGRSQRTNTSRILQMQQNPDALCGIVFMREALVAKIMFLVIVDMSRAHPRLSYLCTQYCAEETPANPGTEPKECQRQGKKQEEVLKKFRMHECNLLLATSALEEGIDLPRCNLVLRWDVPASYRSYGLCRGRARAARSACAVMCSGEAEDTKDLVHNLATYRELDQIISRKCGCGIQDEPPETEENAADTYTSAVKAYTPQELDATKLNEHHENRSNDKHKDGVTESINMKDVGLIKDITENECVKIIRDNDLEKSTVNMIHHTKDDKNVIATTPEKESLVNDFNDMKIEERIFNDKIIGDNDLSESVKDVNSISVNSVNIVCNKCNCLKLSESVECPCLNVNVGSSPVSDNVAEKTSKNIGDIEVATVDLSTAIALINRYCGKLPSDTFTRLAPQWWMEKVQLPIPGSSETKTAYICSLRLPLNCPVKYNIVGHPMPTRVLARRMVALQACRILHKSGELDNQLMPIGKENFKAADLDSNLGCNSAGDASEASDAARPGTTKRRQYYYKKTAWAFTDCQPVIDTTDAEIDTANELPREPNPDPINKEPKRNMLYAIVSKLWCALPERYNTRGRRLHAPQNASQAIGILMAREHADELQIPAFPVYTRSGEVRVSVEYVPDADVRMSPKRDKLVRRFMRFVFAEVLRVRRRGMKLCSEGSTHNNYYIVPTHRVTREDGSSHTDVDWAFLQLIYQHTEQLKNTEVERPQLFHDRQESEHKAESEKDRPTRAKEIENPLLKPGEVFVFNAERYKEAVVTPWYRNQDQPQFFLVAEICWNLTPDSAFPSATHTSFRDYYLVKYGAKLTQAAQPLLDVDHTSARLNLLTPRYVNRKGVALPVSSERTRRAKRDRLDQKQILVPELCKVHPFAAPLWFATVALPCVLYRINALLIADEVRRAVAAEVGLGAPTIDQAACPGFRWPPLDFGWSLAEVLSADSEKGEKKRDDDDDDTIDVKENGEEEDEKAKETEDEKKETDAPSVKTVNDILQEKMDSESGFEIGTWSNDMASSIPEADDYDEMMEPLPPNLTFCTSASGGTNWCEPVEKPKSQYNHSRTFSMAESDCSYMSSDFDTDDSDLNSESDEDTESSGFWSKGSLGVRIEYKTAHEAEAFDIERKAKVNPAPQPDAADDDADRRTHYGSVREGTAPVEYIEKFRTAVTEHEKDIIKEGNLIPADTPITDVLPETRDHKQHNKLTIDQKVLNDLFPYGNAELKTLDGQLTLESIEKNKRVLLEKLKNGLSKEDVKKLNCFSMVDVDIDSPSYVNEKVANVGFDTKDNYKDKISDCGARVFKPYYHDSRSQGKDFDFDYQPPLEGHPGPSPSVILQALTMSNANDGINLERLETIGDSFLKLAITAYLYCAHPAVHEGKLSHMRSKQVSNLNLYRLGRARRLGARMTASKFEPHDNWLPPCHRPPHTHHAGKGENPEKIPNFPDAPVDSSGCFIPYNLITQHSIPDKSIADCVEALIGAYLLECGPRGALLFMSWLGIKVLPRHDLPLPATTKHRHRHRPGARQKPSNPSPKPSPRHPVDSESSCSSDEDEPWLQQEEPPPADDWGGRTRPVGSLRPYMNQQGEWVQPIFGELRAPPSPLLRYVDNPEGELEQMLSGYDALERTLQYRFRDRSLLLQALTHASHHTNRLTDCYQRLEFLGDAVLDYLITRHLYEDARRHSPGALTDLRSALVNNTIFATLAARHGFHKYFRHMSPGLNEVLTRYVKIQEENGHSISEEHYLIQEDEMEQAEDVEVPKALGDLFESVAGAIFLDSGMSLGAVWRSYVSLMGAELEAFSAAAPKSPVRELLEAEPDTAKFGKPERLADGRRVRVCVEVFGRGAFKGVGRNYRIAKGTAARCALRHLRPSRRR